MFDEKELVDLYVENKFSGRQVAERTGIYLGKVQEILRKHGVARRLSDAQKVLYEKGYQHPLKIQLNEAEMVYQFLDGKSLPQLAKEYGFSVTPLRRILRANNTPLRKRIINESAIVELYLNARLSGREISKRTGHSLRAIQKVLKKHKITRTLKEARSNLFQRGYDHPLKKTLNAAKIIALYIEERVSIPKIAKLFNCSLAPILRILKENKISTKTPSASHKRNPGHWKGKKRPELSIKLKGRKISEKTREKLRVSHVGKKSPKKGKTYGEMYGPSYSQELKKRMSLSHKGHISLQKGKTFEGLYGEEKAREIKKRLSEMTRQKFLDEEYKKKIIKIQKEIWSTPEKKAFAKHRRLKQKFPTKHTLPEKLIFDELERCRIPFEKHQTVFDSFQPDAVIVGAKIAIFVDGDYWHANPQKYGDKQLSKIQFERVRRDREQNAMLQNAGWTVLRFWEFDIKKDVASCVDEIEKHLQNLPLSRLEASKNI